MKLSWFLLILCFPFAPPVLKAQTKQNKSRAKSSTIVKSKAFEKKPKVISAGVVNGWAIDLVKPEYQEAARAVNVYGAVRVRVLIGENGDVIKADVLSGHPLLRYASVKAAMQSKFKPQILGGNPVRIDGIIYYYFIPARWNWLEIGYVVKRNSVFYYNLRRLSEILPVDFAEEAQLLQQFYQIGGNYDQTIETLIALIRGKLIGNKKDKWLFEIGLILGELGDRQNEENGKRSLEKIETLLLDAPEGLSPELILQLKNVVEFFEISGEVIMNYDFFESFEEKLPFLGR